MSLLEKKCIPCQIGTPPLSHGRILELLVELNDDWFVEKDVMLKRAIEFPNFKEAFDFVARIAEIAEAEGHHPDLQLGWGYVHIHLRTKKIKGLTESDFILAAKIDAAEI